MPMNAETAAPCRHIGVAPDFIIDKTVDIISQLAADPSYLEKHGLSAEEYIRALPAAIERIRGRSAARNSSRRQFLINIFNELQRKGLIAEVVAPDYAEDTIYRLAVPGVGDVAIIQKGCPDGAHSSTQWSVPDWAVESYLWWICPSMKHEPGVHIAKGVTRLKQKFFDLIDTADAEKMIDGVIFHNDLCGTPTRPCPKQAMSIKINDVAVPPPCLYVFPKVEVGADEWNWSGTRRLKFPQILFSLFEIVSTDSVLFSGHIGFQKKGAAVRINISSGFGSGRSTTLRS
ncbi:MAG: hypothetical protein JWQ10_2661 [Herbaspirillum sp.]|nr:hypothetical protein [Herbaspirillum sp.]